MAVTTLDRNSALVVIDLLKGIVDVSNRSPRERGRETRQRVG